MSNHAKIGKWLKCKNNPPEQYNNNNNNYYYYYSKFLNKGYVFMMKIGRQVTHSS